VSNENRYGLCIVQSRLAWSAYVIHLKKHSKNISLWSEWPLHERRLKMFTFLIPGSCVTVKLACLSSIVCLKERSQHFEWYTNMKVRWLRGLGTLLSCWRWCLCDIPYINITRFCTVFVSGMHSDSHVWNRDTDCVIIIILKEGTIIDGRIILKWILWK
jgi:hypothetical protein